MNDDLFAYLEALFATTGLPLEIPLMPAPARYKPDIEAILARQHANGGEYWASSDGKVGVGSPFSTIQCIIMLSDLGVGSRNPAIVGASASILRCWQPDGRFRLSPSGSIYPCHTAGALKALCRVGFATDSRIEKSFEHLLQSTHSDGGWRCAKFSFGRGPETEFSNPGPTLDALDAFRQSPRFRKDPRLDRAVEFLLGHWTTRKPLGPCHFGIGSRFMKVEYPLLRYNLFNFAYVLSFYPRARTDARFLEVLKALQSRLAERKIVVESTHRELSEFVFCESGRPSDAATRQYGQILRNVGR